MPPPLEAVASLGRHAASGISLRDPMRHPDESASRFRIRNSITLSAGKRSRPCGLLGVAGTVRDAKAHNARSRIPPGRIPGSGSL